jgi:hypothetical protein
VDRDRHDGSTPGERAEPPRTAQQKTYDRAKAVLDTSGKRLCAYCLATAIGARTARPAFVQLEGNPRFDVTHGRCADCGRQRLLIGVRGVAA